ncbi:fungal-specific transcription factor domain-containing protein [Lipomyces kononenkoae]|uniref:Fungal-specific transcription factor domain-containing protein n=1 Tax=Lipomyces kononenkoae TaxID=34357 RepID=A0ACC3SQ18_LIPKO
MSDRRSRNGCSSCRRRRRKCDEGRPQCKECQKRQTRCEYVGRLRWIVEIPVTSGGQHIRARGSPDSLEEEYEMEKRSQKSTLMPSSHGRFCGLPSEVLTEARCDAIPELDEDEDEETIENEQDASDDQDSEIWTLDHDFCEPLTSEHFNSFGERIAFAYWVNYLSGVLTARNSAENPYRKLSKLALASPVLLRTIISIATEHMSCHGRVPTELAIERQNRAISSLREALVTSQPHGPCGFYSIENPSSNDLHPKQAILATVLLQIAHVVFIGGTGVDVHLACAMHLLQDLHYIDRPANDFIPRILIQRFAIYDVLTSILHHRRPYLPLSFWLFIPNEEYDHTEPSFFEMTGCPQPLLGYFARLSNLAADLSEKIYDENIVLDKASMLETDMRIYDRSRVTSHSDSATAVRYEDNLAHCFYWSAHLILQRAIYRDSPHSTRVQHTVTNIIQQIKDMPVGCGPDSRLSFPFYLSSREAVTDKHREWVRERNQQLREVYPSRWRDKVMTILEEIWATIDTGRQKTDAANWYIDAKISAMERERDFARV